MNFHGVLNIWQLFDLNDGCFEIDLSHRAEGLLVCLHMEGS